MLVQNKTIITHSAEETGEIARKLVRSLHGGEILCLYGDLGAGKTTFTQGLTKSLGIKKRIISPTFVIVRQYKAKLSLYSSSEAKRNREVQKENSSRQARTINFYHIDLYRTQTIDDLIGLGIEEIMSDPNNIVAIEWAEKLGELLPNERVDIKFEHLEGNKRKITVKIPNDK